MANQGTSIAARTRFEGTEMSEIIQRYFVANPHLVRYWYSEQSSDIKADLLKVRQTRKEISSRS
jgi:hypothetical protein